MCFSPSIFFEFSNGVQEKFMGLHGLLFFYGVLGIISCFWGLKKIPDNRGKSLVEVEEMYENDVDETKLWEKNEA